MHPEAGPRAGVLGRWLANERASIAGRHVDAFRDAGASDVAIVSGPPDATSFGERLRTLVRAERPVGLVVLGSGAIPLSTERDLRDLVETAASDDPVALANNAYSADGDVTAAVVLLLLGVGGSGALYGSYVQTASANASVVASARV